MCQVALESLAYGAHLLVARRDGTLRSDVAPPASALLARSDRRDGAASFFGAGPSTGIEPLECCRIKLRDPRRIAGAAHQPFW